MLRFHYQYRDAANYKAQGEAIFPEHPYDPSPEEIDQILRPHLIEGGWFIPREWGLPTLYVHPWDPELDHEWYEYLYWDTVRAKPTMELSVPEWLERYFGVGGEKLSHLGSKFP